MPEFAIDKDSITEAVQNPKGLKESLKYQWSLMKENKRTLDFLEQLEMKSKNAVIHDDVPVKVNRFGQDIEFRSLCTETKHRSAYLQQTTPGKYKVCFYKDYRTQVHFLVVDNLGKSKAVKLAKDYVVQGMGVLDEWKKKQKNS